MSDLRVVDVADLHVRCSLKVNYLGQPGYALSDACGAWADSAVQMPSGALLWRCPQHRGVRWVQADRSTARLYEGEDRIGPAVFQVPERSS